MSLKGSIVSNWIEDPKSVVRIRPEIRPSPRRPIGLDRDAVRRRVP